MDDVDDVEITDVNDDDDMAFGAEEGPVKNQDLGSLSAIAGELLSQYGWALLVLTVLLYLLVQHLSKKRSSRSPGPRTHHDSEVVARNQEAMEAARRRMQEELDAKAAIFKDKQKQQEEEKRRQKIEMWDSMQQGKSYKGPGTRLAQPADEEPGPSSALKPKTDRKSLRSSDYSPLSGQGGGSCAWRPGRRGPSAGG